MDINFMVRKVGDWVCSKDGWGRIIEIDNKKKKPFKALINNKIVSFMQGGRLAPKDIFPSVFVWPPDNFDVRVPLDRFKKGQRVFVKNRLGDAPARAIFAEISSRQDAFLCYRNGQTEWTSGGISNTYKWKYCEEAPEEEVNENI